jgi:hypothetical protein
VKFLKLVAAAALAAWLGSAARGCLEVDRCLDAGGRWDDASGSCDGARTE